MLLALEPRVAWSAARTRRVYAIAGGRRRRCSWSPAPSGWPARSAASAARSRRRSTTSPQVKEDKQFDPVRLVSTNSGNRGTWWNEALGAWSDRPFAGWGAGSFALLHLRYRDDARPGHPGAQRPAAAARRDRGGRPAAGLRRRPRAAGRGDRPRPGRWPAARGRDLAFALLAAAVAWLVHGFYDWDLNIPAVTAPVLAMLGLLAGHPDERPPGTVPTVGPERPGGRPALVGAGDAGRGRGGRLGAAALAGRVEVRRRRRGRRRPHARGARARPRPRPTSPRG